MYKKGQKGKKEVSEQKRKDKEKKVDSENDKSREEEEEEEDEERMEEEPEGEEEEVDNWWSPDDWTSISFSGVITDWTWCWGIRATMNRYVHVYSAAVSSKEVRWHFLRRCSSCFTTRLQRKHKETNDLFSVTGLNNKSVSSDSSVWGQQVDQNRITLPAAGHVTFNKLY